MRLLHVHPSARRTLLWVFLVVVMAIAPGASWGASDAGPQVSVIVREQPLAGKGPERLVQRLGGRVGRHISIIDGFVATLPASRVGVLKRSASVHSVSLNRRVRLLSDVDGWDQSNDEGSMHTTRTVMDVDDMFGNLY